MNTLKENRSWMLVDQITNELDVAKRAVNRALNCLLKSKDVKCRNVLIIHNTNNVKRKYRAREWKIK